MGTRTQGTGPAVLPFAPARGWLDASPTRRALAVATAAFAAAWALLLLYRWPTGDAGWPGWFLGVVGLMTLLLYVGGPFGCYAVARILRPHPAGTGASRQVRHMLAAMCTAYGLALLTVSVTNAERGVPLYTFGALWTYVLLVPAVAPATVIWGLIAAITVRTRAPAQGGNPVARHA